MSFTPTTVLNDAALVGGVLAALEDDGINHAYAILFDASNVALVTLLFAKPAATLVAHALVFAQNDTSGDQILAEGSATTFQLFSGGGVLLGAGDVTNMAGSGAMKIAGTAGTLLYAGAQAILGEFEFV